MCSYSGEASGFGAAGTSPSLSASAVSPPPDSSENRFIDPLPVVYRPATRYLPQGLATSSTTGLFSPENAEGILSGRCSRKVCSMLTFAFSPALRASSALIVASSSARSAASSLSLDVEMRRIRTGPSQEAHASRYPCPPLALAGMNRKAAHPPLAFMPRWIRLGTATFRPSPSSRYVSRNSIVPIASEAARYLPSEEISEQVRLYFDAILTVPQWVASSSMTLLALFPILPPTLGPN
mmetsp:Transcript_6650/g.19676  ORF Transcript_6650/g.19676 Transcript_6650/m.19676 type:complete len:238 (+) Transcript_6650:2073-2786(+)